MVGGGTLRRVVKGLAWCALVVAVLGAVLWAQERGATTIGRPEGSEAPTVYEERVDERFSGGLDSHGCSWQNTADPKVQVLDCGDRYASERVVYDHGRKTIYRTVVGTGRPPTAPARPTPYGYGYP